MTAFGVVIPVGAGRAENLTAVLRCLDTQTRPPEMVVVVRDGYSDPSDQTFEHRIDTRFRIVDAPKHEPGLEQPRNVGTRIAIANAPEELTHVAFLDSDVMVGPDWLEVLETGLEQERQDRILVAPYEWLPPTLRPDPMEPKDPIWALARAVHNDPRHAMFGQSPPDRVYYGDLSAGLACFSGNLVWPIGEFARVGGFWSELHHGRCEDGELGLRAVSMGVGISLVAGARGFHLHHPRDDALAIERNLRDVPMLNERHPWVQGSAVFMVDRDGAAFDVLCSKCQQSVPTIGWWAHAPTCGVSTSLPMP